MCKGISIQAMVRRGETEIKHRIYTALDGELFKHDGDTDGDIQVNQLYYFVMLGLIY